RRNLQQGAHPLARGVHGCGLLLLLRRGRVPVVTKPTAGADTCYQHKRQASVDKPPHAQGTAGILLFLRRHQVTPVSSNCFQDCSPASSYWPPVEPNCIGLPSVSTSRP